VAYTYIGKDQGVGIAEVAVGSSTTSKAVEISIDSAKIKQGEALAQIDQIRAYICASTWPPS